MDEPVNEVDFRLKVREIAEGLLLDTLVTFVAMMRERSMTGATQGKLILDEFAAACLALAQQAREAVDIVTATGADTRESLLLALGRDDEVSERVEVLIEERRLDIRNAETPERDEPGDGTILEP